MRESTRIVGLFGALGLGTFAVMLLAAMAAADTADVYSGTSAPAMNTDRDVIIIAPSGVTRDP